MLGVDTSTLLYSIAAVIVVSIFAFLRYLRRNDHYWEKRGMKYQPRMNVFEVMRVMRTKTMPEVLLQNYKEYGRFYGSFQFTKPALVLAEPELLRTVFVKDFHIFSNRQDTLMNDPLVDNMVSVLKGEDWKRVRTIITPAFTSKQMRKMSHIINGCTQTILDMFEKQCQKGEPIDCKALFGAFTTDVIALSVFATKVDSLNDPEHVFVKMFKKTFQERSVWRGLLFSLLPRRILTYFRFGGLESMYFFKEVVQQVIKERKRSGQKYDDLLQTLIDAVEEEKSESKTTLSAEDDTDQYGSINSDLTASSKYKRMSEDELIAQCVLFFFVGYETTASTLAFMAYALAVNQEWQDQLITEVDKSFEKHNEMNYDVVRDMKVLDAVVSETLRMYPPALATVREASENYKLEDKGLVIEKGTSVVIPFYGMHFDSEFFPEPEKFNPQRFMDSAEHRHPQYSYLPFGAGPRNCLGMRFALLEIKLCMANILRHYKFKVGPTTKVPLEFKKMSAFISVNDLPLALEKRNP